MRFTIMRTAIAAIAALSAQTALADTPPLAAERFALGSAGALCEAQGVRMGDARHSIYDRKWALICRDVTRPVGAAYSWRGAPDAYDRVAGDRSAELDCGAPQAAPGAPPGTTVRDCREAGSGLAWKSYRLPRAGRTTVVEGIAAFDSALRLALASIAENRVVPGTVDIVTTGGAGSLALARASLGEASLLIGQGYRENNAGDYSSAEEYFRPDLIANAAGMAQDPAQRANARHEVLVNRALQLSNMGRYLEAGRIFEEARAMQLRDPIQSRLLRNFEAIDAINRGRLALAREILVRPVPELVDPVAAGDGAVEIDRAISNGLNSGIAARLADAVSQDTRLTTAERAAIIDGQARQLAATADRLEGKPADALLALADARRRIAAVREGRVLSTARLEAQLMSEMALSHEALGQDAEAEDLLRQALALTALRYPESASLSAAKARLAAFLARHGEPGKARDLYREIVAATAEDRSALVGLENQLVPYFDMLTTDAPRNPESVADLFAAAQLIERPGAAQTLAQLSRRLEAGDGAASDLFRRETAVRRELNRIELTRAQYLAPDGPAPDPAALAELDARRARLQQSQVELLDKLSAYPAYRSQARAYLSLAEMEELLSPGEAYLQLVEVGGSIYAVYLSPARSTGWKVPASAGEVRRLVNVLRDSISVTVGGIVATYPFDVDGARTLFDALFGPVAGDLAGVRHLVFEPDGALMELPANLLVTDQAGVDSYHARVAQGGDEYDFRGVQWLGRGRAISTALSPASFRDARRAPPSQAASLYLGLGHNEPVGKATPASLVRDAGSAAGDCAIPLAAWNRPIAADELVFASRELGQARSELVTGPAFTDTAIERRGDLDRFRIVHFATHGIVTAPKTSCPVRPALLTSFGDAGSDGLLQFGEIFDLELDADLVILSACNTASLAGLEATQAAGIEGGGGQALDGLVRAFIGAGGRQVIASHWPAPDEFGATRRLFESFFDAPPSLGIGAALLAAQTRLMDDPDTSHPFYWSGFALIGDGERPLFHTN
ncbi:CHAT domain-containing protein [Tsuneonella sp. YG55]|uniref:CHAT domain-containing protein n=1 Tax=Tsuneonella litorea TaxID=2976475 RepID=A0A9X3ALT2_9SPHN|nr:CHAT domain-containing tetratricopeptide repeat protein [Tsuneonella litorea]MCT2557462.1 CHAT domain-containing protein [Tsuneonella litorea]